MGEISTALAPRLSKLIPLPSSNQDGEVLATVAALSRALRGAGKDWHWVAETIEHGRSLPTVHQSPQTPPWQRLARGCLSLGYANLSPSERSLLVSIANWPDPLSQRQERWLSAIAAALQGGVA